MRGHTYSAAMAQAVDASARQHLLRQDQQEDLCFAIWNPSYGATRTTALIERLILPKDGEREVHGNVSFSPKYFERALAEASAAGGGLALLHSHPLGAGWQDMSFADVLAEEGHSAAVAGATGFPFVGLTLAADGAWSARFWKRSAPRTYVRHWCSTVRVLDDRLRTTFMEDLVPVPRFTDEQLRTVSAWGEECQAHLVRHRIGIVGAGSVGGFIAEALARMGFVHIVIIDFDRVESHNLDRLLYATRTDVGSGKAELLKTHLQSRSTAQDVQVDAVNAAVYEEAGFRSALDCDILISCVDRPWGRHALNVIAYAHLIPVIDGGIRVRRNRLGKLAAADWRAHTATIGRACMQCLGQYDLALVQVERDGYLDDPTYIEQLPDDHALKARENVFAFSMACASLQTLQLLALVLAPLDQPDPGAQRYHFVGNFMAEPHFGQCADECLFRSIVSRGDALGMTIVGDRPIRGGQ